MPVSRKRNKNRSGRPKGSGRQPSRDEVYEVVAQYEGLNGTALENLTHGWDAQRGEYMVHFDTLGYGSDDGFGGEGPIKRHSLTLREAALWIDGALRIGTTIIGMQQLADEGKFPEETSPQEWPTWRGQDWGDPGADEATERLTEAARHAFAAMHDDAPPLITLEYAGLLTNTGAVLRQVGLQRAYAQDAEPDWEAIGKALAVAPSEAKQELSTGWLRLGNLSSMAAMRQALAERDQQSGGDDT